MAAAAKTTLVKRRNALADALPQGYKNLRPLQGRLARQTRCVLCGEWTAADDYNPARCAPCVSTGRLL